MWHTLHTISFNYPVKPDSVTKKKYYEFFNSLENILPCKYCRINLKKNMRKVPLKFSSTMKNRESLSDGFITYTRKSIECLERNLI